MNIDYADIEKAISQLRLPPALPELPHADAYQMLLLLVRWHRGLARAYPDLAPQLRALISAQVSSHNWSWMAAHLGDGELADELAIIQSKHQLDVDTGRLNPASRFKAGGTDVSKMLDRLAERFFLYNPIMEEMSVAYAAMHGGSNNSTVPVGPFRYITKSLNSFRVMRSTIKRKMQEENSRLRGYDPTTQRFTPLGKREMRSRLPPINDDGKEYFQTAACKGFKHHISPLYRFHAAAWGMRMYAQALEDAGLERCPFLGETAVLNLTVTELRMYNDPGSSNYCRWMIEVERFMERRRREAAGKKLYQGQFAIYLPMYYDILLPSGKQLTLIAPVTQNLPEKVLRLMPDHDEQSAARRYRTGEPSIAQPCTIEELALYLDFDKRDYYDGKELPKVSLARPRLRGAGSLYAPQNDPNVGLPEDFEPASGLRGRLASLIDNMDMNDEPSNDQMLDDEESV